MKNKLKIKLGFTLIEILIATAIFSLLMVITSGIVAESSGYQAKIKALRSVSMETRKIADFISSEVRSADSFGTINYINVGGSKSSTYSASLAIFSCGLSYCDPVHVDDTEILAPGFAKSDRSNLKGNVLITFVKENGVTSAHILVYKSADEGKLYFEKVGGEVNLNSIVSLMTESDVYSGKDETDGMGVGVAVNFGGFAPAKSDTHQRHSYVTFLASAKTRGYDTLASAQRATASIRSMVVLRSY